MTVVESDLKPKDFRIGSRDNSGEIVERIYYQHREYIIYRTQKALFVDIDDDSPRAEELHTANTRLHPHLSRVYSLLDENLNWTEPINRQIARAVALNITGATAQAIELLSDAESRIRRLKVLNGRLHFTLSSLAVASATVLFNWVLLLFTETPATSVYIPYADIAACGAMGGFLSVVLGFRILEIDLDASWSVNCLIGASRILVAIVAAVFAYFVVKSGIAFQPLNELNNSYGVYAIAMVAGFSEQFVPGIMENLTRDTGRGNQQTTPEMDRNEESRAPQ